MSSTLSVITKAKDLADYIFQVTDRSPKKFRMTLIARMQNLTLDILEYLYRANDIRLSGDESLYRRRCIYQSKAKSSVDVLCCVAEIAKKQQCIQPKHFYQISIMSADIVKLLNAWIQSDEKRIRSLSNSDSE